MSEVEANILAMLQSHSVRVRGAIVGDIGIANRFYANVAVELDTHGRRVPSREWLQRIRDHWKQIGVDLVFLLSQEGNEDLDVGLRATLLSSFSEDIRNAFSSIDGKKAHVWVEFKKSVTDSRLLEIEGHVRRYFALVDTTVENVSRLSEENTPGKLAILTAMRVLAPVEVKSLESALRDKAFVIPSTEWLTRRLDALRKSGEIIQRHDRKLCLSLLGLRKLGTRKDRKSQDITRMLALPRRTS